MKRLIQSIEIYDRVTSVKKLEFPTIVSVNITKSRLEFTDKANVFFNEATYEQGNKISDLIKKGDNIVVYLGYFDKNDRNLGFVKEFDGYVSELVPTSPVQLKCEDSMYILKQTMIEPKVFKDTTFKEVLSYYYKEPFEMLDADIGTWVIGKNSTLVDLFDEWRNVFGTLTYFKEGKLYCNAELAVDPDQTIIFNVRENVPLDTDRIKVEETENYKLVVHGISPQVNGTKVEKYAYYEDINRTSIKITSEKPEGVLNVIEIPGLTVSRLEELMKRKLPILYQGTTQGEIETFGAPSFNHGDRGQIEQSLNPSADGLYDIVAVDKRFSASGGFRQRAKIGLKII